MDALFSFLFGHWFELLTLFLLLGIYEEVSSIRKK